MNPLVSEEQQLAIDSFRNFLEAEIRPVAVEHRGSVIPAPVAATAMKKLAAFGVGGGVISEKNGGAGLDFFTAGLLYEELARVSADLAITAHTNLFTSRLLDDWASEEICEKYLTPTVIGDISGCIAVTEPDAGSNVVEVGMRARREEDHYVLNGEKKWVTNGEYANYCIVAARTSDEPSGITHILVDRNEHGYEVENIATMGLEGSSTDRLFFSDVRVPVTNTIGAEGQGVRNSLTVFEKARIFIGLTSVGIAQAALDAAIDYATERKQHGKHIAGHQLVAGMIAEMATHLAAARLLCHRGLMLIDAGVRCDTETSMAKWYATEIAVDIASKAVQIHGANGFSDEYWVEKYFRDAKIMPIPDGPTEIHKLLIARNLTGISTF